MKISEILGKKVIDSNANDIGKIQDIDLDIKENTVNKIFINTNELSLRKVGFEIVPENISQIGDYILLNVAKSEIFPENESENIPDIEVVNPSELEEKSKKL